MYPDFGYTDARDTVAGMDIETNISIGRCLARLREQSHLKQVEVAERLGKPQSFVSKVENGERSLHACELVDYSEALDIPTSQLMSAVESAIKSAPRVTSKGPEAKGSPKSPATPKRPTAPRAPKPPRKP